MAGSSEALAARPRVCPSSTNVDRLALASGRALAQNRPSATAPGVAMSSRLKRRLEQKRIAKRAKHELLHASEKAQLAFGVSYVRKFKENGGDALDAWADATREHFGEGLPPLDAGLLH